MVEEPPEVAAIAGNHCVMLPMPQVVKTWTGQTDRLKPYYSSGHLQQSDVIATKVSIFPSTPVQMHLAGLPTCKMKDV